MTFFEKFGLSMILIIITTVGLIGLWLTLVNVERASKNGTPVFVKDVKSKNSESIGYIATYIIPFVFQGFDTLYECLAVIFLLFVIYRIYINSSLLLINPLLSFWFGIYEIVYTSNNKEKDGLIITKNKSLQDDCNLKLYEIGHKLYFATN